MSKIDKKMAVFLAMSNIETWVSISELLIYLGEGFAERTTRRWLNEWVAENKLEKTGQKKSTLYKVKSKAIIKPLPLLFTEKSRDTLEYVKQPIYLRKPTTYQINYLESYHPNDAFYLSDSARKFLKKQGKRSYTKEMAGTYAKHIYNRLLIDLSYNSSRLEGNTYSLLDTEKLIIEGISADSKLDEEKIMILNHKEAIRYLIENIEKIKIEPSVICTLHYLLADGLLPPNRAGRFRDHDVKIGGSTYIPLSHSQQLEKLLLKICEKSAMIQDPYEQSFFLLTHLAYLQAFEDVNKRTSRLSANIPLIYNNLVPLSFNDIPKDDYNCAMIAIYELNDTTPLAELYCFSYERTCQQYDSNIEAMGFNKIRIIYRAVRKNILRHIIINKLTKQEMEDYINKQTLLEISKKDQTAFIKIIHEDLAAFVPSHILGLGISIEQFNAWKILQK